MYFFWFALSFACESVSSQASGNWNALSKKENRSVATVAADMLLMCAKADLNGKCQSPCTLVGCGIKDDGRTIVARIESPFLWGS